MRNFVLAVTTCAALGACSASQVATTVADGQLFCAKATADGPLVVALSSIAGAPVIVTGLASATVAAACAAWDVAAVPVAPPASPATAPIVAAPVVLPAAAT